MLEHEQHKHNKHKELQGCNFRQS